MKVFAFLFLFSATLALAEVPPRVALLGDSITYDGRWASLVESALRGTERFREAEIVNFGLSSETVSGLSEKKHAGGRFPRPVVHERLERILTQFKPTLVLAAYGMNCGIQKPKSEERMKAYFDGILQLKQTVEGAGARLILVTPSLFRIDVPEKDTARYQEVLDAQSEWLLDQRENEGWEVIDIRPHLRSEVQAAKEKNPSFRFAKDALHPGTEGHRLIAEAVVTDLWPLLELSETPEFARATALEVLRKRHHLLKLAWLSKTKHLRPGIPAGLPLAEAEQQAQKLLQEYLALE